MTDARRYLLGDSAGDEAAIERAYFDAAAAGDVVAAAEEALIDDYLAGRLSATEHSKFEQHYLSSRVHRIRVETIRHVSAMAGAVGSRSTGRRSAVRWLAAAAVLLVGTGAVWILTSTGRESAAGDRAALRPSPNASVAAPAAFAFSLSPGNVRGADDRPPLVIPAGTATVALRLEPSSRDLSVSSTRVVVATVAGDEVWTGEASRARTDDIAATVSIPASQLRPDDYIVVLYGRRADGAETERERYFLRVRSR